MPGENGVYDLGHHRIVVAHNAGEYGPIGPQPYQEIVAQFIFDAAQKYALFGKLRITTKFAKCLRKITQGRDTSRGTTTLPHGGQLFVFYASTGSVSAKNACGFAAGIANEKLQAFPVFLGSVSRLNLPANSAPRNPSGTPELKGSGRPGLGQFP